MSFVFWRATAIKNVDDMQVQVPSRYHAAISAAVAEIHDKLTRDPVGFSESRAGSIRVNTELPPTARFKLSADSSRVDILRVRFVQPRSSPP